MRARILGRGPARPREPAAAGLDSLASAALVATDDAIRTSDQELGFATARFGERAAAPFTTALAAARAELARAFQLRQLLDDDVPRTEPARRSMRTEICARCAEANRLLDEQSRAFDRLQDLRARAPEVLSEVTAHVAQQDARVPAARQTMAQLAAAYTEDAVAVVLASPDQAGERLEFARTAAAQARQRLAAGQTGRAAVYLQAAESAADQAESLLNAVEHLRAALTQAASMLPAALREIEVEVAEAGRLLSGTSAERAAVVGRAQQAGASVRDRMAARLPLDTLAALRELAQTDAALDHALASARAEHDRQDRARALLDQAMLVARSSVATAEDFITTRRGGVGARARTRLAEARRHFQQAIGLAQHDPAAAVTEAQQADALSQHARSLAEQDVARLSQAVQADAVGGALRGGILLDSLADGFGTPGSFGGAGTRGRRRHDVEAD